MTRSSNLRRARWRSLAVGGLFVGVTLLAAAPSASASASTSPANLATNLYVTANSVMAAASVPYNGNPGSVAVGWGDGSWSAGSAGTPTTGALLFRHEYTPPTNGSTLSVTVTAVSGAETVTRTLTIIPRYLVEKGADNFSPLTHCDSFLEQDTEWHVDQDLYRSINDDSPPFSSKHWDFDRATGPNVIDGIPNFQPLPGSNFSFEMTMSDAPIYVWHHAREIDLLLDEHLYDGAQGIHPSMGNQSMDFQLGEFSGDCKAEITTYVNVTLLKPLTALDTLPLPPAPTPPPTPTQPPRCPGNPRNCQEN